MPESNEFRLLLSSWLVTGTLPQPQDAATARALIAAARPQGLIPLLYTALGAESRPSADGCWPAEVLGALRREHHTSFARGVHQLDLLARVRSLLADRGLRALPLKGAAVAERLYASVAERPMSDVDLLVLDDWAASVRALEQDGLRLLERGDHASSFVDPASKGILELHHSITSCPGFYPLDRDGLWARSVPGHGQISRLPSPEDLLVHLSLHAAFQHGLVLRLVQYLDFRRLLERNPPEVDAVLAIAARARAEAPLAAALEVARRTVGAPVPPRLEAALEAHLPHGIARLRQADALAFIEPAPFTHPRVRWALAAGRRGELVVRTLAPREPGAVAPFLLRSLRAVARGAGLLKRWGLPLGAVRQ